MTEKLECPTPGHQSIGAQSSEATERMLPCPNCGETDVDATAAKWQRTDPQNGKQRIEGYNAGCMVCGMFGPDSHTPRDAADRWNALPRKSAPLSETTDSKKDRFTLTGQQVKQLATFSFGTDLDDVFPPEDAMDVSIGYLTDHEDGPGWYVWGAEYPEEGALPLVTYKDTSHVG